jgi:hypothetical protein
MAFENTRFTIMALPQSVDAAGVLTLNILFVPRNISPLEEVNTVFNVSGKAPAFVDVKPEFDIRVVNNPDEFPGKIPGPENTLSPLVPLDYSTLMTELYKTLRDAKDINNKPKYFDIDENRSTDKNPASKHRAQKADLVRDTAIRKYLPESYRQAFNFTSPRIKNAVTDDSYHCAMRDQTPPAAFTPDNKVSWGKVYAHLLRQPLMAMKGGLLYKTTVQLAGDDFEKGGWIYVNIKSGTTYAAEQTTSLGIAGSDPFIKRYAARIPALKPNEARSLFAAVLFPVMKAGETPAGIYDELYIEAARFNDGFATIVHANQPVSGNLLKEEQDGFHPQKDLGIRLGWEDEQILIWYLRQLAVDENASDRLDAPLGVSGYHIDVKPAAAGPNNWESLTAVKSNGNMMLEDISIGNFEGELPYQVYPSKIHGLAGGNYWLPMYFANWNNASLVIPDDTAAKIYANKDDKNKPVAVSNTYSPVAINTKLKYGNEYNFRVRLADISGGGPLANTLSPDNLSVSHIAHSFFKRYVAPHAVTVINESAIQVNTDDHNFSGTSLQLSRPLLGYPAVVYTGKYSDPVARLQAASQALIDQQIATQGDAVQKGAKAFGIPDPDITAIEIKVEVETLQMDNLASDNGREHYITLYKTTRTFNPFHENAADETINTPIEFVDADVLDLSNTGSPFPVATDNDFITATAGLIRLPSARNIRITLRAVGIEQANYWGHESANPDLNTRFGKTTVITLRQESKQETNLFIGTEDPQVLQAIYLQPDPLEIDLNPVYFKTLQGGNEGLPNIVQRLGKQLDVEVKELSLNAKNGERLQFWCSSMIRHSMAPDNSSLTFASKNELQDHWLVCTTLYINRDWTWDSLAASSFHIQRRRRSGRDAQTIDQKSYAFIGDLELKKTASFQAIQSGDDGMIHREYTKIIVVDVVDNKTAVGQLPDTIELQYSIVPKFRTGHNPDEDGPFETAALLLPTTINPSQAPKLIGAGMALSPYNRNKKYSATEARTRYLWLEFDKAPIDPNDGLFCRVLAYAPDQLISNNHPSLMDIPKESPLVLNPEYIRVVTPVSGHDHSGLNAMQQMEKSTDVNRHFYLLPIPPGLHHESAELFGFFTYEFRYGHTDRIWSTAQGRFGRALRVAGLQHPAPTLNCMINRDEKKISVNAPYALAVYNGKNVTAKPARTSVWALLYAQVKQADGLDYRNILLDEMELRPAPKRKLQEVVGVFIKQNQERKAIAIKKQIPYVELTPADIHMQSLQQLAVEEEIVQQAYGTWQNKEVTDMLHLYGLPGDSNLSVVCVEVFGQVTNAFEHIDDFNQNKGPLLQEITNTYDQALSVAVGKEIIKATNAPAKKPIDPLNSQLGLYRILRTSPLTEVPFVCCTDCV